MNNNPQLFCFTYAGGTKEFFNEIEDDLTGINLVKLEYAGHGERHKEKFYNTFDELADDLFREIQNSLYKDYSLFGYSMGSISAVEVLKRIIDKDLPQPKNIFLAAHEPHTKAELLGFSADELDEWVKNRTILFGAVPEKLLNNKVFWRTYLPVYRADYTIIDKYKFDNLRIRSSVPATVFFSETDTPYEEMKQWNNFFSCDFYQFPGTHFFIHQHHEEMARIIRQKMGLGNGF